MSGLPCLCWQFGMSGPSGRRLPLPRDQHVLLRARRGREKWQLHPCDYTGYAASVQQGHCHSWVNWSYPGSHILVPSFWRYLSGRQLAIPNYNPGSDSVSINLNNLTKGRIENAHLFRGGMNRCLPGVVRAFGECEPNRVR